MAKATTKGTWKHKMMETKLFGTLTGKMANAIICQNSRPEDSKYPDAAPEDGVCTEWVFANPETAAVLCSSCVQRLMAITPGRVELDNKE
jgi:hypothetical protein